MGRKPKQKTVVNTPNYDQITTIEAADTQIALAKDTVCRKVKLQLSIKEAKKEADAAYNEQLKELAEEIDTEIGVLGGWESRKLQLASGPDISPISNSNIVPMPSIPFRSPVAS